MAPWPCGCGEQGGIDRGEALRRGDQGRVAGRVDGDGGHHLAAGRAVRASTRAVAACWTPGTAAIARTAEGLIAEACPAARARDDHVGAGRLPRRGGLAANHGVPDHAGERRHGEGEDERHGRERKRGGGLRRAGKAEEPDDAALASRCPRQAAQAAAGTAAGPRSPPGPRRAPGPRSCTGRLRPSAPRKTDDAADGRGAGGDLEDHPGRPAPAPPGASGGVAGGAARPPPRQGPLRRWPAWRCPATRRPGRPGRSPGPGARRAPRPARRPARRPPPRRGTRAEKSCHSDAPRARRRASSADRRAAIIRAARSSITMPATRQAHVDHPQQDVHGVRGLDKRGQRRDQARRHGQRVRHRCQGPGQLGNLAA